MHGLLSVLTLSSIKLTYVSYAIATASHAMIPQTRPVLPVLVHSSNGHNLLILIAAIIIAMKEHMKHQLL